MKQPDFTKSADGLVPAIIQHHVTRQVLMLGYMNQPAFIQTLESKYVTFYSRSKQRLWVKGETSGHHLKLIDWKLDCDEDTVLILADPSGPVCHKGDDTCFEETFDADFGVIMDQLNSIILDRKINPKEGSYTSRLFQKGINKIAQKVGEEAVELVIEAKDDNQQLLVGEAADLLYHFLVLLAQKNIPLSAISSELKKRMD